jgi:hypothetical protein
MVTRGPYYQIAAANSTIEIERHSPKPDPERPGLHWTMDFAGNTPDIASADFIGDHSVRYRFSSAKDTDISITAGSLSQFQCDTLIINNHNPFQFDTSPDQLAPGRTCIVAATAGIQTIVGQMGECTVCPIVEVWSGSDHEIIRLNAESEFSETAGSETIPFLVIISPVVDYPLDFSTFRFVVSAGNETNLTQSEIIFHPDRNWAGPTPNPVVHDIGNLSSMIGIVLFGLGSLILLAIVLVKEKKLRGVDPQAMLAVGSLASGG